MSSPDRQGELGALTYSVQGNILTSAAVLDQAIAALPAGCDLPDRLMRALEAGAANGEGDNRCTPGGIPADSAFLQVDRDGEPAGSYLVLDVTDTAPDDPIARLRAQYDAWRASHPTTTTSATRRACWPTRSPPSPALAGWPAIASTDVRAIRGDLNAVWWPRAGHRASSTTAAAGPPLRGRTAGFVDGGRASLRA